MSFTERVSIKSKSQFSPKGKELEWQHWLQIHWQQLEKQLVQCAGALRVLADNV